MKRIIPIYLMMGLGIVATSCKEFEPIENFTDSTFVLNKQNISKIEMVTREMEVPDYHTLLVGSDMEVHYVSSDEKPFLRITGEKDLLKGYKPCVQGGCLILTHWYSGYYYFTDQKVVVETNSKQLKGFGTQEVVLGNLARKLDAKGDFDWKEGYIHKLGQYYAEVNGTEKTFYYCSFDNRCCGFTIDCHRKNGKTTLDMVYDTVDFQTAQKRKLVENRYKIQTSFNLHPDPYGEISQYCVEEVYVSEEDVEDI